MATSGQGGGRAGGARAIRALERRATTLGAQVARSVYERWRRLPAARRARLAELAASVREQALDLPGEADPRAAGGELRAANERLAAAIVESAAADPEVSAQELRELRAELARELERVAEAAPGAGAAAPAEGDVSSLEVRDLRAELARELERLAGAEIEASRGAGRVAGEAPAADGRP